MTSGYNSRFERRDLVLATVTAIFGVAAVVMAAAGVLVLVGVHFYLGWTSSCGALLGGVPSRPQGLRPE